MRCSKTKEAILIDPVFEQVRRDAALLEELGLKLICHARNPCPCRSRDGGLAAQAADGKPDRRFEASGAEGADVYLKHGDEVRFGTRYLEARATPGHTHGCVSYVLDDESMAFTGDTLLIRGCGRTDFQQGEPHDMYRSVHLQLFTLPDSLPALSGARLSRADVTSVGEEKRFNPRLGGALSENDFVGYMNNLKLPHPKKIDIAVPANLKCGKPRRGSTDGRPRLGTAVLHLRRRLGSAAVTGSRSISEGRKSSMCASPRIHGTLGTHSRRGADPAWASLRSARRAEKDRPVVAVCRAGGRSAQATVMLQQAGFTKVANLAGRHAALARRRPRRGRRRAS